ncbi:hypothetical protein GF386_02095 [Candidatus Pacearchaeota archaeon]|nr:hypothetical protein [Candidatus Pacearchaeota archaeon]MBD3282959.1 hypothetical protein [Candidatus Pacearchaeota archaeon]
MLKSEPSFSRGTAVEGSLSPGEYSEELERLKDSISRPVRGFINGKRSYKWQVVVTPLKSKDFYYLEEQFKGSIREYLDGWSEREIRRWERGSYKIKNHLGYIFPHHNLVFLFSEYTLKDMSFLQEEFENLGYKIVLKRNRTSRGRSLYSEQWSLENHDEVLRMLRDPENSEINAADSRAQQIVDLVHGSIGAETYNYAVFIPKHWVRHLYDPKELRLSPVKKVVEVPANWRSSGLDELCKGLPLTRAIGLTSGVKTGNREKHIPMIDFEEMFSYSWPCPDERVNETLKRINIPGIVVSSGASYHFYGFDLLESSEWIQYMDMLKQLPYVDKNWPDLQLKQGFPMLRLTPSRRKFSQPCYLRNFHPDSTGSDSDSDSYEEQLAAA